MGVTELDNPTSQFVFLRVILGSFMISRMFEIWSSAVRPAKAGVLIFSLSSDHRSQPHEDDDPEAPWVGSYYLTAPRWAFGPKSSRVNGFDEITASWTKNNLSTYLIDSGLWGACRQSHCVMRDILGPTKPIAIRTKVRYGPDMLSRFLFEDVIPNNTARGLLQIPHVGWQYHPSWASSLHESSRIRSLDSLCCYIVYGARFGGLETLWLINYRIKRKHWVSSKEEFDGPKPKVFETDEFWLIEVEIDDNIRSPEQLPWDEVVERGDFYTLDDFLAFVRLLRQLVTHTLLSNPALQTAKPVMGIKVLAYEDLQ
ncbi:uncharacterized protein FOBCDRAFT_242026 [Fusarium oxysporum Fo47]|uniref:uncharacterized protein n=1 Tax=Fusarium oxysporum Fo47 TaxID=660027 RepID=UPI002869D05D|nr:uncharacterized protein FOBCDRAFT_242026 [Fusarium oxysporum Fo47]QKD57539.2 hypothetical protein FOBCDRAFT_242026 [Fusarium oxysporum Fo47]